MAASDLQILPRLVEALLLASRNSFLLIVNLNVRSLGSFVVPSRGVGVRSGRLTIEYKPINLDR